MQVTIVHRMTELIRSLGHSCAVVGGIAICLRVRERLTKDIDLAVATRTDREVEALVAPLRRAGFMLRTVLEQTDRGVIATLRFALPGSSGPDLDLLCASCGIEREIVAGAEPIPLGGGKTLPVAKIPHLIAMKVLAESDHRAMDRADLLYLIQAATTQELAEAEAALGLIASRGFHRGKNLIGVLQSFRDRARPT